MQMQNPIDVQVGKCLRDMRFEIGWPVDRLAAAIGVTSARMIEYESGEARMEARVMAEICRVLNVVPSTFFAWSPEASSSGASTLDKLEAA